MALKDLITDHKKIAEEAIEKIITGYIKYDPAAKLIVFTPEGGALPNERKLLVYLVAVLGWQYVTDEPVEVSTKPADLETITGIHGGTLRPLLKKLKDSHLLTSVDGHYTVQAANLDAVGAVIAGTKQATPSKRTSTKRNTAASDKDADTDGAKRKSSATEITALLEQFIAEGFFDSGKTLSDLEKRYHEVGAIIKMSSISGKVLKLVRERRLVRTKVEHNGRMVWLYKTAGK